jgi:hypothetical protein
MDRPQWAPESVDLEAPSAARVWDYFLGGSHNFAADRRVADAAIAMKPDMPELARRVRRFLQRAVTLMSEAGVTQFLDIGAGIPTVGPVHEVARAINPSAKVAYIDHDPVAVAHGKLLLADDPQTISVWGDLRSLKIILSDAEVRGLLDFSQPVAVLLCAVLHFVPEESDPAGMLATLRDTLVPGSYVAIQHATHDMQPRETVEMLEMWNANSPEPMFWRSKEQITDLFSGFDLVEPGVVFLPEWRPDPGEEPEPHPERFASYAAVGVKP